MPEVAFNSDAVLKVLSPTDKGCPQEIPSFLITPISLPDKVVNELPSKD